MKNWREYIDQKFQPTSDFTFKSEDVSNTLTITHIASETNVSFIWPRDNWTGLADIQFYNPKTRGWSGEYWGELDFSEENIKAVDSFLDPVFKDGWTSIDTYIGGNHWKSKVYRNLQMTGTPFTYYSSETGCLATIFFPITWTIATLFGKKEKVLIQPINSKTSNG